MRLDLSGIRMFQDRLLTGETRPAGLAALVHALSVKAPVRQPSAVSDKHIRGSHRDEGGWRLYDKRYWPGETFADHLTFALRHENLDLLVLKRIFRAAPKAEIEAFVRAAPTGVPARRAWFLYELLTGDTLDIADTPNVAAVDLLDDKAYFTGKPRLSKRHRVRDNLLGTKDFAPVIRRTPALAGFTGSDLAAKASDTVGRTGAHVISRAASFLLLADSRASFAIEGESPPRNRLERWGRAVVQAGRHPLTVDEIVRLHGVLIEDNRLIHPGLRPDGVFLGERDHENNPLPEFIGARPGDLDGLMAGLIDANARMREDGLDPVLQAAATAFGFVYVHPFQDGNGRLHRCLIHHVLAERKFTPPGLVFPVSSVMLDRIDDYRTTLQSHSGPLMEFIDWRPTPERNVEVLNDTADLYRYYDCTEEAEFLYGCVKRTVEHDLPHEIDYLRRHDEARRKIMETVEMPDRLADDLLLFIRQNNGTLSKKRREKEFEALTNDEVERIEQVVRDAFDGFENGAHA
ncbi:Fic family protein [Bradyrhizobium sp. LHD-71]|uniref:Fic family protein n=1 Tax=Bradyrhizobium sp. LHD-71 TaxID=3072141 RepID=UPI0028101DEA|nr:Fic family protein [Bradyrhizobium sp. LHD-71]MDQ8729453.1 Fic family protein [Bradyrhizobium sp. LHD-71]